MKISLLTLLFSFQVYTFAAGDAAKGEVLYKKCMACHGKDGMGLKSQKAPMLAGQFDWYIETQVTAIRDGARANNNTKKMLPFVKNLTTQDIKDLSAYISALPKRK